MALRIATVGFIGILAACGPDRAVGDTDDETEGVGGSEEASTSTSGNTTGSDASTGETAGSASTSASSEGSTGTGEHPDFETQIDWQPCPVFTAGAGEEAQCATIEVPADWSDLEGPTLEIFVKRIGAMQGDKQLWMLMGGPGGSARNYESSASTYTGADPGLTVYLLDHRGTGRSSFLECPAQEAPGSEQGRAITLLEAPDCIEYLEATYGETLPHYNTDNAAGDLGWLIDELRGDEAVHVFGSSYGTYWGQRYLQLFPEQADSMTLLGITHPTFSFTTFDPNYNAVGEALMADCGDDAFCSTVLGPDPAATMAGVYELLEGGHCPLAQAAGIDRSSLRVYFSSLLSWAGDERARIAATIYRLQRCNDQDVAALVNAAPQMQDPLSGLVDDPFFSVVVNRHVSFSEIWEEPFPTQDEIDAWDTSLLFSLSSTTQRFEIYPLWPVYPEPPLDDQFARTGVPMLMLNGEYDPNTPPGQASGVGEHYDGPNQTFMVIPDGNHGWFSPTSEGWGCAENVFFSFIQDPTAPLLDCMDDVMPIDWAGSPGDAQTFFGTDDLYENP